MQEAERFFFFFSSDEGGEKDLDDSNALSGHGVSTSSVGHALVGIDSGGSRQKSDETRERKRKRKRKRKNL